ncbi:uncharacterized protein LOC134216492 [Armigeres subalbatus]|uniref:uncharacterized protein LOC134216492 n=1 Tax=Armigeres subalbatus TaxID=124917 RepID=UPI002ED20B8D
MLRLLQTLQTRICFVLLFITLITINFREIARTYQFFIVRTMNTLVQKSKPLIAPKIWKRDEILTFLDIFESTFHASVTDPFESEDDMWKCISNKLLDQGIIASVQQCLNKWNFLYKTYISNQNRQGLFYAKVKQIVELSQEINESREPVESYPTEQVEELDTKCSVKVENFSLDAVQMEVLEESLNDQEQIDEHTFDKDPMEDIAASNQIEIEAVIPSEDSNDVKFDEPCDSPPETNDTDTPAKRVKLSESADQNVPTKETSAEVEENMNIHNILQTILSKLSAIQDEQIKQGRRIENIEKIQNECLSQLSDLRKYTKLK